MKETIVYIILFLIVCLGVFGFYTYRVLQPQSRARYLGGDSEITLTPGEKLQEVTWKDENLWILTREMRDVQDCEV